MPRKPDEVPQWGTDQTTEIEPVAQKTTGWLNGAVGIAGYMNWFKRITYEWVDWLDNVFTTVNQNSVFLRNGTGPSLDLSNTTGATIDAPDTTLTGNLSVAGTVDGVTSLTMAGALSGATDLTMGGALDGVTDLTMTGTLTGNQASFTTVNPEYTTNNAAVFDSGDTPSLTDARAGASQLTNDVHPSNSSSAIGTLTLTSSDENGGLDTTAGVGSVPAYWGVVSRTLNFNPDVNDEPIIRPGEPFSVEWDFTSVAFSGFVFGFPDNSGTTAQDVEMSIVVSFYDTPLDRTQTSTDPDMKGIFAGGLLPDGVTVQPNFISEIESSRIVAIPSGYSWTSGVGFPLSDTGPATLTVSGTAPANFQGVRLTWVLHNLNALYQPVDGDFVLITQTLGSNFTITPGLERSNSLPFDPEAGEVEVFDLEVNGTAVISTGSITTLTGSTGDFSNMTANRFYADQRMEVQQTVYVGLNQSPVVDSLWTLGINTVPIALGRLQWNGSNNYTVDSNYPGWNIGTVQYIEKAGDYSAIVVRPGNLPPNSATIGLSSYSGSGATAVDVENYLDAGGGVGDSVLSVVSVTGTFNLSNTGPSGNTSYAVQPGDVIIRIDSNNPGAGGILREVFIVIWGV